MQKWQCFVGIHDWQHTLWSVNGVQCEIRWCVRCNRHELVCLFPKVVLDAAEVSEIAMKVGRMAERVG